VRNDRPSTTCWSHDRGLAIYEIAASNNNIWHDEWAAEIDNVLKALLPNIVRCAEAQTCIQEEGIVAFIQQYIPIEMDQKALVFVAAKKGTASSLHKHCGRILWCILAGKFAITYKDGHGVERGDAPNFGGATS
jgi:hypothetical protein